MTQKTQWRWVEVEGQLPDGTRTRGEYSVTAPHHAKIWLRHDNPEVVRVRIIRMRESA